MRLLSCRLFRKTVLVSFSLLFALGCSSASHRDDSQSRDVYEQTKANMSRKEEIKPRAPNEVAPGYEIKLSTNDDPHLNGKFRIEFEGRLKLPYNVNIVTDNLTLDRLKAKINEAYAKYFKTPPDIRVSVSEERYWIDVRGLVEKPGRFLVKKGSSLDEALLMAGGLQKNGNVAYVKIQLGKNSTTIKLSDYYSGSPQDRIPPWRGGEILFFQTDRPQTAVLGDTEKTYIQFIGEVKAPGEYRYVENADFYYYLVKAGGPTERANLTEVRIVRNGIEGKKVLDFDLDNIKEMPPIEPGDILFIQADKASGFERKLPLIAGIVGIISSVLLAILVLR
jgi:protein involved in polysaccharide export with SLBB domain